VNIYPVPDFPRFLSGNAKREGIQRAFELYKDWKQKRMDKNAEDTMKKMLLTTVMVLLISLVSWPETRQERHYVNLSFTVWKLKNGPSEALRRINTPIPEVFRESWICDFMAFDVTQGKPASRELNKDGLRFVLTAEPHGKLTIQVYEREKEVFRFVHNRPSTVNTIFYGANSRSYLIEATHTAGSHPIGLVSPGILKKSRSDH
jgi:hypothetical protein